MKFNNIILIIFTVLSIACSSDTGSDSGDSNNTGNNTGGNNNNNGGNNSGGNSSSGETTDPNDFSSFTSPGNTTYYISFQLEMTVMTVKVKISHSKILVK